MEMNYVHNQDLSENKAGLICGMELHTDAGLQS